MRRNAVDELRFHVGTEQQHADIDDIERRAQRQQLPPYDLFAALRLLGAAPGSFLFGRLRRLKHQTDLLIGLPGPFARLRLAFARNQQMEMLGNAERAFDLDDGADIGHLTDDAIDRRLAVIRDDLAGQQRTTAGHEFLFAHGGDSSWISSEISNGVILNWLNRNDPTGLPWPRFCPRC